jgi:imidazolonepropionase-like amidohydrolase
VTGVLVVDNAAVMTPDGGFAPGRVVVRDGAVSDHPPREGEPVRRLDGRGLWLTPGIVDAHTHLGWGRFEAADRPPPGAEPDGTARRAAATLAAGVTAVRDAGGLATRPAWPAPRVQLSVDILGAADAAGGTRHLRDRVRRLVDAGADWIKVAATGGVGAPPDRVLDPALNRSALAVVAGAAEATGTPVMVHAWGGVAVDWAIELGVRSIEHAVLLTPAQARAAAAAGVVVVPTVRIYQWVAAMADAGAVDLRYAEPARRAVAAHPSAVQACLEAGTPLALGTDAGTDAQHGRNLEELAALAACGLTPAEALVAATVTGARLLGLPVPLQPGAPADLVLFRTDPRAPGGAGDRQVAAVLLGGRVVAGDTPAIKGLVDIGEG